MIRQINDISSNILDQLCTGHYARRIKSTFQAYGGKYDFCRFYVLEENNVTELLINQFNSTMIVSMLNGVAVTENGKNELVTLIDLNKPQNIEMNVELARDLKDKLTDYEACDRTEFEYVSKNHTPRMKVEEFPDLDDVYSILKTSFPAIAAGYDLWLTDTSHKIRRNLSQCFMLGNFTTATVQYICDGVALVGQVATVPEERGRYHARKLLYWIGEKLNKQGLCVKLFARNNRVSYYEEIGFKENASDIVFERKMEIE